jgi:methionyl-tRNA formyltransferase
MRIIFFGTPHFALPSLKALHESSDYTIAAVVCQPDRPAGRGKKLRPSPTKLYALDNQIPLLQPTSIKRELSAFREQLDALGPFDGAVVVAFGQILPQALLDYFSRKCINIHASLLPLYRGAAPIQRAVMQGEKETGVCLMQIEAGLDSGPVYQRAQVPIEPGTTSGDLHETLSSLGASLITTHLQSILSGDISPETQDHARSTHAPKISKDEAHIIWNHDAFTLQNTINGISPFPGAYTKVEDKRLKVLRALENSSFSLPPGQVRIDGESCYVGCAGGVLELKEVQLEGKKAITIDQFLKCNVLKDGTTLT